MVNTKKIILKKLFQYRKKQMGLLNNLFETKGSKIEQCIARVKNIHEVSQCIFKVKEGDFENVVEWKEKGYFYILPSNHRIKLCSCETKLNLQR